MTDKFDYKKFRSKEFIEAFHKSAWEWVEAHIASSDVPFYQPSEIEDDDVRNTILTEYGGPLVVGALNRVLVVGLEAVESPIEMLMFIAMCLGALVDADAVLVQPKDKSSKPVGVGRFPAEQIITIEPQVDINQYRVDFLLKGKTEFEYKGVTYKGKSQLIVECDGHEFHEKTKEQASRDKERDRTFVTWGYKVFRFSGSDIFNDPTYMAHKVTSYLRHEMSHDARLPKNAGLPVFKYWKPDKK